MKMTLIDDDNARFFEAAIGERYRNKNNSELYAGVIDDAGEAVCAGIFIEDTDGITLDFIAVAEERRRQGIGSFLLREMKDIAKKSGIESMRSILLIDESDSASDALLNFLKKNDFAIEEFEGERSVYDLYKVMALPAFAETPLKHPFVIKSVSELSKKEREQIMNIDDPMIDPSSVLSLENRYGGVVVEKHAIRAILVAEPFYGGVHITSIYSNGDGLVLFPHLFDHARDAVRNEGMELEGLYIDTVGEKMALFNERFLGSKGIHPVRKYRAYEAVSGF